jgi:tape measure domain-containing protein
VSVVANVAINVDSRQAVTKLRQVQSQSQATERAVGNLGAAVGKLAAALGVIQAARFVFVKTAELESQARSLQVLTGSAEKAGQIIKELQQLGAVTPFTSSELIDSAKRLQAFGVETNKVVETTRRLADVSGATGAELQGLVTAYGQVQAKGRLQGEELLQFQERGVALQQELRKQYNLSGEEFQDALSKGKISAEAVEFAIQNLTDAGGKYANGAIAQSDTLNGRFSTLQDGIEGLARTIGTALTPAIKAVLNEAIFAINTINQLLNTGARARSFGLDQRARKQILDQAQQEAQDIVNTRRIRDPFERNRQFQELAAQRERDLIEAFGIRTGQVKPQATAPQGQRALPPLGAGTAGKGRTGKTDAEKAAEKAAREAEKLAQEIQRSLELGDRLGTEFSRQVLLLGEANEIEQKRLQIQFDYEDRAKQIAELKNTEQQTNLSQLNDEIRRLEIIDLQTEALKKQLEEYYKLAGLKAGDPLRQGAGAFRTDIDLGPQNKVATFIQDAQAQLQDLETRAISVAQGIGDAVANSLVSGIQGLIAGTQSAKEVFANFLQSIGQILAQEGTKMIATYIAIGIAKLFAGLGGGDSFGGKTEGLGAKVFGSNSPSFGGSAFGGSAGTFGFAGRANGGPVASNTPYMVGEQGPELFVPNAGGSIVNNNDLRSAMGASNGSAGGPVLNMSFETTSIGGTEYVSREQLEAAMVATRRNAARDGARQGMSMTLDKLQQSPGTRGRVGLR